MKYKTRHQGSEFAGMDLYQCPYCKAERFSEKDMDVHIDMMHPDKIKVNHTQKELQELAKKNGLSYRGNKQQIAERLRQAGISL